LEAETAITKLPPTDREVYRKLTAERISILIKENNPQCTQNTHPETKIFKSIKTKLKENEAMVTRADKGNSLVMLPIKQYDSKINDFILANKFQTTTQDPTKSFQSKVRKVINNSKTLIPPDTKWKFIIMNPTALTIKGLIKLHKPEQPIRPVVNWRRAPAYKLASLFTPKIRHLAPLPNTYNLENTTDLITNLKNTSIFPQFTLTSLDITNLYMNIPVTETREIIAKALEKNVPNPQTRDKLISWYDTITKQNYFTNNKKIMIQK
jgi:hypothetical protein